MVLQSPPGQVPEPDLLQPARTGRDEVQDKTSVSAQPALHSGMFVGRVVIDDQMQVQLRRCLGIDLFQELQPLLMPVSWLAFCDDPSLGQFR